MGDDAHREILASVTNGFAKFLTNGEKDVNIIGGDTNTRKRVVYLVHLTDSTVKGYYKLYVGSTPGITSSGHRRIAQHQSPIFRAAHPSLFYHTLDNQSSRNASYSILCEFNDNVSPETVLLAEAICAALFRVMPNYTEWDKLLPKTWQNWMQPCGLNISSPIQGNANFSGFGIDLLRNSGDPETEAYYKSVKAKGQAAQAAEKRAKALEIAQEGGEVRLCWKKGPKDTSRWLIRIGCLEVDLNFPTKTAKEYGLVKDQLLSVKYDIVAGEHPHRFIDKATPSDDCWSLGVRVTGAAKKAHGSVKEGGEFEVWLRMKSFGPERKAVKMANTIVDFVSGIPPDTLHTKSDRYYRHRTESGGKKTITYT